MAGKFLCPLALRKIAFNRSGTDRTAAIDHAAKDRTVRDARELQPGLKRGHRTGEIGGCPLCANSPAIRRRDAALPWGFWCAVHRLRRRSLGGEAIETLFGA